MLNFECDYLEGAHPEILKRLEETNMEKTSGYTTDEYCESAREKIRAVCGCPEAEVEFMVGGTQTNSTMIAATLRPYEGVIACESAHIATHEAGTVEAGGHKVLTLPEEGSPDGRYLIDGKIHAASLRRYLDEFNADPNKPHMVIPGMVYISQPTEYGTLYKLSELEEISKFCRENGLPLYLDGARLGYGAMSPDCDWTLKDIARLCDFFYIGGTKVGALFGEAVVIPDPKRFRHLSTLIKQHGVLLAKGRILGIQFDTLFTDNLYFEISKHAIDMSMKLTSGLRKKFYRLYAEPQANLIFPVVEDRKLEKLAKSVRYSIWGKVEDPSWATDREETVIRFATSWATEEDEIDQLIDAL